MKRTYKPIKTCIISKPKTEGLGLEEQIQALITSNEPIQADAPMIYNENKEGVKPEYDIRTDRWEIAQNAADNYARSVIAKSAELNKDITLNINSEDEPKKED